MKDTLVWAIDKAAQFIYIEDQYFTPGQEVMATLRAALRRDSVKHLTVVIPEDEITTSLGSWMFIFDPRNLKLLKVLYDAFWVARKPTPWRTVSLNRSIFSFVYDLATQPDRRRWLFANQAHRRRMAVIGELRSEHPEKVRIFTRKGPGQPHSYVHSKLVVVDDELAIIGSANCNRRSHTHDSEVLAAIADECLSGGFGYTFAHRLRVALWAEHLFGVSFRQAVDPDAAVRARAERAFAECADGVASATHWLGPTHGVVPYNYDTPVETSDLDEFLWDHLIDPVGS